MATVLTVLVAPILLTSLLLPVIPPVFTVALSAEKPRPFLWSKSLRKGTVFADPRLPYRFTAPDDLVYRIWKEGMTYRFEARSYRKQTTQITMTTLLNRRKVAVQSLRDEINEGCAPTTERIEETANTLQLACEDASGGWLLRKLETTDEGYLFFFEMKSNAPIEPPTLQIERSSDIRFVLPPE